MSWFSQQPAQSLAYTSPSPFWDEEEKWTKCKTCGLR